MPCRRAGLVFTPADAGASSGTVPAMFRLSASQVKVAPASLSAPAPATGIGPGSHLLITRKSEPNTVYGCTANFVWSSGGTEYLGAAGHCFLPASASATSNANGPGDKYNPSGDETVQVCISGCDFGGQVGFVITGTVVTLGPVAYARQNNGDPVNGQLGNDFGIVTIPSSHSSEVRPTLPVWGGPTTATGSAVAGTLLCHYGNGVAAGETYPTMARTGVGISDDGSAWYADLAATPGDSGSAVETCTPGVNGLNGVGAVGILTHLTLGTTVTAGTTVSKAMSMTSNDTGIGLTLVTG